MALRLCYLSGLMVLALVAGCSQDEGPSGEAGGSPSAGAQASPGNPAAKSRPTTDSIDFGDDDGDYSQDGECDDKRFAGKGMSDLRLLNSEIGHDASDCRAAYKQERISLLSDAGSLQDIPSAEIARIAWGDDRGEYANDGECDDKRFTGPGMTKTRLYNSDVGHDARDCREAFARGQLSLKK